jgi:HlyD family secretion protein
VILLLAAGAGYTFMTYFRGGRDPFTGPTWTVKKEKLLVNIIERGSLESAENSDIIVRVKAGSKSTASIIKWVVEDGTRVNAGDRIVELDDSAYQDQLKTLRNTVQKSYSEWIEAKTNCTIQEIQNEIDIKSAEVVRDLKELDLKKYVGHDAGTKVIKIETRPVLQRYLNNVFDTDVNEALVGALVIPAVPFLPSEFELDVRKESSRASDKFTSGFLQTMSDLQGKIETARSDKETWLDRASWSQRMVKKGYYSRSQAEGDQSRLASAEISLRKVQGDLDIYMKFDLEKSATLMWSDLKEAERALKKVVKQADLKMEKAYSDEASKRSIYDQELDRLRDLEKDEKWYRMVSPQDGMVVYYVPEQSRSGSGSQQSVVAQGEPVREGQKLMRIPNLNRMMVNARVHEAMVSKLRGEVSKPTGYTDMLRSTFTLGRHDIFGIASYYGALEEVREKWKDKDQHILFPGHKARIRVDAYPGKSYQGHVKTVATVASQAEFFSSDVKVYQTMVSIEGSLEEENLRPGMSAEVTITASETSEPVLVIPIQAVLGNLSMGENRKCYVLDAAGYPQLRDIVVGLSSDKFVEVKSGVQEGEKVVINPRGLIPESSGMKPGTPSSRRGADMEEGGEKKSGKKKDGGKGGGQKKGGGGFQGPGGPEPKMFNGPGGGGLPPQDAIPDDKKK